MTEMTQQGGPTGGEPVDEQEHVPDAAPRCHACGALRPPAVAWCTQCYARFDAPGPGPVPDDGASADLGPAEPDRPPAPTAPVPPEEVEARAQELLARLAGEDAGDGRVRSWSGLVQGNRQKVVAMVIGTVVLTGLLFAAMAAVGALL